MDIDRRIRKMVDRIDAEKVTVSITYDRDSWWRRRGKGQHPFEVEIEWENHGEKFHADGDAKGRTLRAVFDAAEAEVNGILIRQRAGS